MRHSSRILALVCVLLALPLSGVASAHAERDAFFPSGELGVPQRRVDGPTLVVCKDDTPERLAALPRSLRIANEALLEDCEYEHVQEAVDAVTEQGTRILLMPGLYREEPSYAPLSEACEALSEKSPEEQEEDGIMIGAVPISPGEDSGDNSPGTPVYTYEEQRECPTAQNLISVFGDTDGDGMCDNALCDLQIEGTGERPEQVIIDGAYKHLNGLRADRADGLYLRNFTVQRFEFNAVYALETDGFVFDRMVTRWNDEYGFLSFAVDHGLYESCEGYGNGDSVIYPGSASDLNQGAGLFDDNEGLRFATEIRNCRGHHSTLGYSGTAGNSVLTHHNEFDNNVAGFATDSLFPDHPGLPQDHAYVHDNIIHSNNSNYYDNLNEGRCTGPFADRDYDEGTVCPVVPLPVGSGIVVAGGNTNLAENNRIYDNRRQGVMQFFVPAALREEYDPTKQFDTSNFNTWRENAMGANPNGTSQPNGVDFWWDGEGEGNCWADNTSAGDGVTYSINDAAVPELPGCDPRPPFSPAGTIVTDAGCATYDRDTEPNPPGCDWFEDPAVPADREPAAPTLERVAGPGRIETAVLAAQEGYPYRAATVVLARADVYPDALSGAPLADFLGGPVLLTASDELSPQTAEEITRLGASRAVVLGGPAALSPQVESDLADLGVADVTRVAGKDRFSTSVEVAKLLGGSNAYLARGVAQDEAKAWPDALAASAIAAHQQRPVLLTGQDALPEVVRDFLLEGQITDLRIAGGAAAVSPLIEADLKMQLDDVERISGADRYETSLRLAEQAVRAGADPTELWLATGTNWPDALVAGAPAAVDEGVVLLTDPNGVAPDSPTGEWLSAHADVIENVRVLGGPGAISEQVVTDVKALVGATEGDAEGDRSTGELVSSGAFEVYEGVDSSVAEVVGDAVLRRTVQGTTEVEVLVDGLPAEETFPVHVHNGLCPRTDGGALGAAADAGPHFQFEPGGATTPPNEIHATFKTDEAGVGRGSTVAYGVAGPTAKSVNLHTADGTKIACADLVGPVPDEGTPVALASFMQVPSVGDSLPVRAGAALLLGAGAAVVLGRRRLTGLLSALRG